MGEEFRFMMERTYEFLDLTQIQYNHPDHDLYYRDISKVYQALVYV